MKDMKTVKNMKGGWPATLMWPPGFAGLGLWATATDQDRSKSSEVLSVAVVHRPLGRRRRPPRQCRWPAPFMSFIVFMIFM